MPHLNRTLSLIKDWINVLHMSCITETHEQTHFHLSTSALKVTADRSWSGTLKNELSIVPKRQIQCHQATAPAWFFS